MSTQYNNSFNLTDDKENVLNKFIEN